jgi:hypothetical protein
VVASDEPLDVSVDPVDVVAEVPPSAGASDVVEPPAAPSPVAAPEPSAAWAVVVGSTDAVDALELSDVEVSLAPELVVPVPAEPPELVVFEL